MGLSADDFVDTPYLHSWAYDQEALFKKYMFVARLKNMYTDVCADSHEEAIRLVASYFRTHDTKSIHLTQHYPKG